MTNNKKLSWRHRVTEPELPLFFDLIRGKGWSKNKPTCENAVSQTLYGNCTLQMGSWSPKIYQIDELNEYSGMIFKNLQMIKT